MSHTYAQNVVHVVFSTKGRHKAIEADFRPKLWAYVTGKHPVCSRVSGRCPPPQCTIFAVFEIKMEILAPYLALPKSSLFGRTSAAEPTVILIRNL